MDFNPIVFSVHIAIFVLVMVSLKYLYFDPVLAVLKKRDELTQGKQDSANQLIQEIEKLRSQYLKEVESLKGDLESERQASLKEVRAHSEKLIQETKTEVESALKQHSAKINQNIEQVRQSLPDVGSRLGDEIVEAVVHSNVVGL